MRTEMSRNAFNMEKSGCVFSESKTDEGITRALQVPQIKEFVGQCR
jgi:hypothetical protein